MKATITTVASGGRPTGLPAGQLTLEGYSPEDHLFRVMKTTGRPYEYDLLCHLARAVPHAGLAIDVGANIGNHACFFAAFVAQQVVAIEPHPDLAAIARRNAERNSLNNLEIVEVAIGERRRKGTLSIDHCVTADATNTGLAYILPDYAAGAGIEVEICALDDVIDEYRLESGSTLPVTLIKVDVEGGELEVLAGAVKTIDVYRPHLVLEASTSDLRSKLDEFLARFGYHSRTRFCATPTYHYTSPVTRRRRLPLRYHLSRLVRGCRRLLRRG